MYTIINMLPPSDGSLNSITVNGRVYSSTPGISIPVPSFDANILAANDWTQVSLPTPLVPTETWAARMRRWESGARGNNPFELPRLRGAQAWRAAPARGFSTAYTVGQAVTDNGQLWLCTKTGSSAASGALSGTFAPGLVVTDGTTEWLWQPYTAGTYFSANGNLYAVATGGLPATTGSGPTGRGVGIADGTAVVDYIGPQESPTVRFWTTADATLTHSVAVGTAGDGVNPLSNTTVRYNAGIPYTFGGTTIKWLTTDVSLTPADPGPTTPGQAFTIFELDHIGVKLQITFGSAAAMAHSIAVDGQYIDAVTFQPTAALAANFTLDFTGVGRKWRTVRVSGTAMQLWTIATEPSGQFSRTRKNDDLYVVAGIGDSHWSTGSTAPIWIPDKTNNFFGVLAEMMGWPLYFADAITGTGYIQTAAGGSNYITRCIQQLKRIVAKGYTLHAIAIEGSQNDVSFGTTAVTSAALNLYQSIRAAGFNQPIFVVGTYGSNNAGYITNDAAVKAAVAQMVAAGDAKIFYIDIAGDPQAPVIGTGNAAAPNGSGTADFDIGSDGTHGTFMPGTPYVGTYNVAKFVRGKINAILASQS